MIQSYVFTVSSHPTYHNCYTLTDSNLIVANMPEEIHSKYGENSINILLNYLSAQISVPKLTVNSSSSHSAKHVRIDFNDFLYRL